MTPDLSAKSDDEIDTWILNHEKQGKTDSDLFRTLLEERAKRNKSGLKIERSLEHLVDAARRGAFTTYGDLASANGVLWSKARHAMNGQGNHLDNLLDVCHARGLPLLTAICVNQQGVHTGTLEETALAGFTNGARRLGYKIADGQAFLKQCQKACFDWGKTAPGPS